MKRPAYYLISQHFHNMSWHDGVGTAWNYDGRGAKKLKTDRGPYTTTNISGEFFYDEFLFQKRYDLNI